MTRELSPIPKGLSLDHRMMSKKIPAFRAECSFALLKKAIFCQQRGKPQLILFVEPRPTFILFLFIVAM